jgi:hypothetical protein
MANGRDFCFSKFGLLSVRVRLVARLLLPPVAAPSLQQTFNLLDPAQGANYICQDPQVTTATVLTTAMVSCSCTLA